MSRLSVVISLFFSLAGAVACQMPGALPTTVPQAAMLLTPQTSADAPATTSATNEPGDDTAPADVTPTGTSQPSPTAIPSTATSPPATPAPWVVAVDPGTPIELQQELQRLVEVQPAQFALPVNGQEPDVTLVPHRGEPLATWTYAVVVPFATLNEATTLVDLQTNWREGGSPQALVDNRTGPLLAAVWGQGVGQSVDGEALGAELWARRPAWSLVPFHRLDPSLKVLPVDGVSPLSPDFDPAAYPLTFDVGLEGNPAAMAALRAAWQGPTSNYDAQRLTRVAMSGVTALVRATAYQMETRGLTYPGEEVAAVLRAADLAHVSNEVSFVPDCPAPHYIGEPVFCSSPRYLALLEDIGVDIVELTGNHLNDWGSQYVSYSLDLYEEAGMRTFGGGRDLAQARMPLIVEHHGNRLAFVGCNPVGPFGAWATPERAGAASCDYDELQAQIAELQQSGHLVIVTQQYQEIYNYAPTTQQQNDFRALAAAGAAAVSGSQGHHAQGFDFHEGSFIHYGLGNLFFDQMDLMGTRQTMVDTYTIYDNRLLNVQIWTGLIENYARPRLMTPEERRDLLQTLFTASGW